jgi:hypothetical protein
MYSILNMNWRNTTIEDEIWMKKVEVFLAI